MVTDTETTEVEEEGTESTEVEGTEGDKVDRLEAKVDGLIERFTEFLKGGKAATPAKRDDAAEVGDQVKAEVAKLQAEEKAKGKETAMGKRLDAIEAKISAAEKQPVEYRAITKFFWGEG